MKQWAANISEILIGTMLGAYIIHKTGWAENDIKEWFTFVAGAITGSVVAIIDKRR